MNMKFINKNRFYSYLESSNGFLLLFFAVFTFVQLNAQVVAGWEMNGLSSYGPSPFTATTRAANTTIGGLTRGSGIGVSGTAAGNAWGGNGTTATNFAAAVTAVDFVTFTIRANSEFTVSLTNIAPYNIRRSGTGSTTGQWQYSVNGSTFVNIGSAITWGSNTSSPGNAQASINLSGISALQNVPSSTTITFRLVLWGGTGAGGPWYFNQLQTGNDLIINGSVVSAPLPVTLLSFSNSIKSEDQILTWTYESPENFDYFDIEHSRDARSFTSIGKVREGENVSGKYSADFTHHRPAAGIHYYRLKMVDLDGSYEYSNVIQGRIEAIQSVRLLSTFISSDGFDISVEKSLRSLELRLVDQLGRTVYQSVQSAEAGIFNISVSNLTSGIYFLQVNADGVMETYKLVK